MKRFIKIVIICFLSLIGLIVLSLIAIRLYYNDDRLKTIIVNLVQENTGGKAALSSLETHGLLDIQLRDLEIKNPANDSLWFRIGDIQISIKPLGLLTGDLHVSSFSMENIQINYGNLPEFPQAETEVPTGKFVTPVDLVIDSLLVSNFTVNGPEIDFDLNFNLSDVRFSGVDRFSGKYELDTNKGLIHYDSQDLSFNGNCDLSANGVISSSEKTTQSFKTVVSNIGLFYEDSVYLDDFTVTANTVLNYDEKKVRVSEISFDLGGDEILAFEGEINLEEPQKISLSARKRDWELSGLNSILHDLKTGLSLNGVVSIKELNLSATPSNFAYDFEINLDKVGIGYANSIYLGGLTGAIYSDGEPDLFVFGSSLTADSLGGSSEAGPLFSIYGISTAMEAELSGSELDLNMSTGISDFLGGKFDIDAFTQQSKIDGEIRVDNVNLSKAASGLLAAKGIDLNGIFDLALKISGNTDSIFTDMSANLEEFKVVIENDSLFIPQQEFKLSASTILNKNSVDSRFNYGVQKIILGDGDLHYPLKPVYPDSIIMTYKMNLDNSVLPSYFPSALLEALGAVELNGGSVIDGRFTSPVDTFLFTGSSRLKIEPTDILIDDLQSVLYSLISVSEFRITDRGMSLSSNSGIEDLFNENYSDLDFSGITIEGEIVSLSDTTWRITNMSVNIPSLKSSLIILGDFGYSGDTPFSSLKIYFNFNADERLEIADQYYLGGQLKAEFETNSTDTLLEYTGTAIFNNVEVESKGMFKISGINGHIPVSGKINLQDSMFVELASQVSITGSAYQRARLANLTAGEYGRMRVDRIDSDPFYISDVSFDAGFKNGALNIPYITGNLLGGDFYGAISLDITDVNLMREIPNYENLKYQLDLELSDLDFNQLTYNLGPFESRADFGADAHFVGNGIIAPGEDYSISGNFHITKMGPGVALRVLDVLDPENNNPGIIQTRELLNRKLLGIIDMSYKPKNFSFELKHGSLYPRLYMDQPFFADVLPLIRIPMPVEYGRIPVKSLMANLKEESW